MTKRQAPIDGYGFGAKRHYRRAVWSTFRRLCGNQMADKVFAIMPSTEGAEIEVALNSGVREKNLILIDRNPAIVASLKRKYPQVTTYGVTAARAAERIRADFGEIHGVNLDLCGSADRPLFETLRAWTSARVITDLGMVAVTVLRGRERKGRFGTPTPVQWSVNEGCRFAPPTGRDALRLAWINALLTDMPLRLQDHDFSHLIRRPYVSITTRTETYKSAAGTQTLLWSVLQLHRQPCLCDDCLRSWIDNVGETVTFPQAYRFVIRALERQWGAAAVRLCIERDIQKMMRLSDSRRYFRRIENRTMHRLIVT